MLSFSGRVLQRQAGFEYVEYLRYQEVERLPTIQ